MTGYSFRLVPDDQLAEAVARLEKQVLRAKPALARGAAWAKEYAESLEQAKAEQLRRLRNRFSKVDGK